MAEIVDYTHERIKRTGEEMFLGCACGSEAGYQVVVFADADDLHVATIVCNGCQGETDIDEGILMKAEDFDV